MALDLRDISYPPSIEQLRAYVGSRLFDQFYEFMMEEYQALCKIEYSRDVWAPGWNLKLKKAGKSLCVVYPKEGYFTVLVVVGRKEKEMVQRLMPQFSEEMQTLYQNTKEGNGQRWLMIDLSADTPLYQDTLRLIRIRRESR